jgi:hypothetical protein
VLIPHDRADYRWRNLVERLFRKPKNWRRVDTRYDKTKQSYLGFITLASIKLWIPFVHDAYLPGRQQQNSYSVGQLHSTTGIACIGHYGDARRHENRRLRLSKFGVEL